MPQPLVTGRIVWSELADANGIRKLRPAVVVTPTDRITAGGALEVVAITSRLSHPLPADHVLLPWHPQGHPRTLGKVADLMPSRPVSPTDASADSAQSAQGDSAGPPVLPEP
jgi:hypothetical protein